MSQYIYGTLERLIADDAVSLFGCSILIDAMGLARKNVAPQETSRPRLMIIIKKNKGVNPLYLGSHTQGQDDAYNFMKR